MAPFLPESYPRRELSVAALAASPKALARAHFLLSRLAAEGAFAEGETLLLGGQPVAVWLHGRLEYVGAVAPAMEKARAAQATSLGAAAEFLAQYFAEGAEDPFAGGRVSPGLADSLRPAEPHLLLKLYWLKQSALPRALEALRTRRADVSARLPQGPLRRAYKRNMLEQIEKLQRLEREVEHFEFEWLKAFHGQRFKADERAVDGYQDYLRRLQELEQAVRAAGEIGESLSRQSLER